MIVKPLLILQELVRFLVILGFGVYPAVILSKPVIALSYILADKTLWPAAVAILVFCGLLGLFLALFKKDSDLVTLLLSIGLIPYIPLAGMLTLGDGSGNFLLFGPGVVAFFYIRIFFRNEAKRREYN